jgi:Na+-transporting NADH:ubiquinone oxidoreductase subunit F
MSFWYGARGVSDLFYNDLFETLEKKHANFNWHTALSESDSDDSWSGDKGYIHDIARKQLLDTHPDLGRCKFLICGPPPMLKAVLEMLDELGVNPSSIAFDDFGI